MAELLGHWWSIEGHVRRGDQRGRTMGFPTANIDISHYIRPAEGIYAVWAEILAASGAQEAPRAPMIYPAIGYFGRRPTFNQEEVFLEVFLFDFDGDLYGRQLRVSFIELLRGDQTFASAEALKAQMDKDAAAARRIHAEERGQLGAYELGLDAIAGPHGRQTG
jgi:riboflavin kinase/FMN adenylyltransferase